MSREIDFSDPCYVANMYDCLDRRIAALEAMVEKFTSTNSIKPKMPSLGDFICFCASIGLDFSVNKADELYKYFARHFGH